jgi:hypothetical protein
MSNEAQIVNLADGSFTVATEYNGELVKFYRSLPGRQYCFESKIWKFPLNQKEEVLKELTRRNYVISNRPFIPIVHIQEHGTETDISCKYDKNVYQTLHNIPSSRWDQLRDLFVINSAYVIKLLDEMNKQNIPHEYVKATPEQGPPQKYTKPKNKIEDHKPLNAFNGS